MSFDQLLFFLDYIKSYFFCSIYHRLFFAHPEVEEIIDGGYKAITFFTQEIENTQKILPAGRIFDL